MPRCSRSEIGSISESDEKEVIVKKYQKYKEICKELIVDNEQLKQKNSTLERRVSLEVMKTNDLESDNNQLAEKVQNLESIIETQKNEFEKQLKESQRTSLELQEEVATLNNRIEHLNDQLIIKQHDVEKYVEKCELQLSKLELDDVFVKTCNSWWCPKHSSLKQDLPFLVPTTSEEKVALRLAVTRQKYWVTESKIRCCVLDCKTGVDKHTVPPACFTRFLNGKLKKTSFKPSEAMSVSKESVGDQPPANNEEDLFNISISSDDEV